MRVLTTGRHHQIQCHIFWCRLTVLLFDGRQMLVMPSQTSIDTKRGIMFEFDLQQTLSFNFVSKMRPRSRCIPKYLIQLGLPRHYYCGACCMVHAFARLDTMRFYCFFFAVPLVLGRLRLNIHFRLGIGSLHLQYSPHTKQEVPLAQYVHIRGPHNERLCEYSGSINYKNL